MAGMSKRGYDHSAQAIGTLATRLAIFATGGVASIAISRNLGPVGRGDYYVLITIASTAYSLGQFSVDQACVAQWTNASRRSALRATALLLGAIHGLLAAGVAWLGVQWVGHSFPIASERALLVALVAVPFGVAGIYTSTLLLLDHKVARMNAGKLVAALAQCAALVVLAATGQLTVAWVVVLWTLGTALPLVVHLPALHVKLGRASLSVATRTESLAMRYHVGVAATFLLWRVDVFLLNPRVTRFDLGLYSLAVTIAEMTFVLTQSVAHAVLGRQAEGKLDDAAVFTARVARTSALAGAAAAIGIVAVSPFVIPALFGERFSGSIPSLATLAPGIVALGVAQAIMPFLVRLERPLRLSALAVCALGLNVLLNLALIPVFGIVGAALASTVSYGAFAVTMAVWLVRSRGLPLAMLVPRASDFTEPLSRLRRGSGRTVFGDEPLP